MRKYALLFIVFATLFLGSILTFLLLLLMAPIVSVNVPAWVFGTTFVILGVSIIMCVFSTVALEKAGHARTPLPILLKMK